MLTIVSFFTPDGPNGEYYTGCAARLSRQCASLAIPSLIVERPYCGAWMQTIHQKPAVILAALNNLCSPVLWMDVDTQLVEFPREAARNLAKHDFTGIPRTQPGAPPYEVFCAGFAPTENARALLRRWAADYNRQPDEDTAFKTAFAAGEMMASLLPMTYRGTGGSGDVVRMGIARHEDKAAYFRSPEWVKAKRAMENNP